MKILVYYLCEISMPKKKKKKKKWKTISVFFFFVGVAVQYICRHIYVFVQVSLFVNLYDGTGKVKFEL